VTPTLVLLVVAAYLTGSIPSAYLAVKWARGIDIRRHGTGNVGAANVLKLTSKRLAIAVTVVDIGKGALMVWLAQLAGLEAAGQAAVGVVAIIGHNWPVFLNFRGGRGIFTSLGVITVQAPLIGLIMLVGPYLFAPVRQLALGVFLLLFSLPFLSWFLSQPLGVEERLPITLGFIALSLVAFFRRLVVPRSELSQSISPVRLYINRLLFDRDISDRKAWINRQPTGQERKD
jgi:glycerol-3-phosphate acyltransferase PlsY